MIVAVGSLRRLVGLTVLCALVACFWLEASADAAVPFWQLSSASAPASFAPGASGAVVVTATNLGEAEVEGASSKVVLLDSLPAGFEATSATGKTSGIPGLAKIRGPVECSVLGATLVECVFEGKLPPYEALEVSIAVNVLASAKSGEVNEVSVFGGGAAGTSSGHPLQVGDSPVQFGVANYEQAAFGEDGSIDTQAGSHPFGLTTTLDLNRTASAPYQPALPKDLHFDLPPGLIGNPTPFPQCSDAQFGAVIAGVGVNQCPPNTAVGVAAVTIYEPALGGLFTDTVPVFNLKPSIGEPAKFGFLALVAPVILDTSVRTGGDYGVTVSVNNIIQLTSFIGSKVTLWGVPGLAVHDQSRGWECIDGGFFAFVGLSPCNPLGQSTPPPLISMPTSCTGPMATSVRVDSWSQAGAFTPPVSPPVQTALDGCNRLPFAPSIRAVPDGQAGSTPTGLNVNIHQSQDSILSTTGLAPANVKDTVVTLPAGVVLNPSAADGLESCSEAQIGLSSDTSISCPEASKVGTVKIKTPLLPNELEGAAYLAAQNANPFGSLVALYIVAEDPVSGTLVKVAGEVRPDPVSGQLVSTFPNTPQLPFEDFELHFFGGDRAPLGTPALCGSYTTQASITPWSGNEPATPSSTFDIDSGPNGRPCVAPLPFSPSLTAGTTSIQAGGLSPFTMTMSRGDGDQDLQSVQLHMPPGLLGQVALVTPCAEAQANAGTCGPESLIGHTTVSVGLGGDPYSVAGGEVFLTGPYEGAPYGLSIVNPAKAGPFDLGKVVVRAKIEVDPTTADLTVTTDPSGPHAIPHILDGIPLQIQHVNVSIDRPGFTFNPTDCKKLAITGSLGSDQGSSKSLSVPFQVTNCATLVFKPQFKVSTQGKTSRRSGASLDVKLSYPAGSFGKAANIKSVKVDLPRQLPSRLTTLQKACPDHTFDQNPASCPAASRVGSATASTPILAGTLTGPAYFVSHGGAKFPELVVVLSGDGVTVYLNGETFISKQGITSSIFRQIPDVPVSAFELKLPQSANSALAANGNLCAGRLKMPTVFTAQNGAVIKQSTPVAVTGCPKHKAKHRAKGARHAGRHGGTRTGSGR